MRRSLLWIWLAALLAVGCQGGERVSSAESAGQAPSRSVAPAKDRAGYPAIVAFGDSLSAGTGVDPRLNYPSQLQDLLDRKGYPLRVINAGVGGETTAQGLSRLPNVIELKPRLVILELGGNDGLRGLPILSIRKNLGTIIERLKTSGIPVVLAGMRIPPNYGPRYTEQFHQMYADLAAEHRVTLIPFFLEGVAGNPDLNLEDGIHPNGDGYRIVTQAVFETIRPLL